MDVMTDPSFWGQVTLTAAARLAVLAAVIWVAKIVIAGVSPASEPRAAIGSRAAAPPDKRNRLTESGLSGSPAYFDLRLDAGSRQPASSDRNVMRDRLMDYLRQRSAERSAS